MLAGKDKRVKLIKNNRNKGVSGARNTGIGESKGEFIAFLDSDDLMLQNSLRARVEALVNAPLCDVVSGNFNTIDENSEVLKAKWYNNIENDLHSVPSKLIIISDPIRFFLEKYNLMRTGSVMIRRKKLFSIDKFNEQMTHFEDEEFWNRLLINSKLIFLNNILFSYRLGHVNASSNKLKVLRGRLDHKIMMLRDPLFQKYRKLIKEDIVKTYTSYSCLLRESYLFSECAKSSLKILLICPNNFAPYKGLLASLLHKS